jgi:hypothetical protein
MIGGARAYYSHFELGPRHKRGPFSLLRSWMALFVCGDDQLRLSDPSFEAVYLRPASPGSAGLR